jgi:hypothetical protein
MSVLFINFDNMAPTVDGVFYNEWPEYKAAEEGIRYYDSTRNVFLEIADGYVRNLGRNPGANAGANTNTRVFSGDGSTPRDFVGRRTVTINGEGVTGSSVPSALNALDRVNNALGRVRNILSQQGVQGGEEGDDGSGGAYIGGKITVGGSLFTGDQITVINPDVTKSSGEKLPGGTYRQETGADGKRSFVSDDGGEDQK